MSLAFPFRRAVSSFLTVALLATLGGLPTLAADSAATATLEGRLLSTDGASPLAGMVLQAARSPEAPVYRSERTDEAGRFVLEGLPAGTYGLAVETPEGLYRSAGLVTLEAGATERVLLGLAPGKAEKDGKKPDGGPEVVDEKDPNAKKDVSLVNNPLTMTLFAIGGVTLLAWGVDELDDDDEDDEERSASPSAP